VAHLTPKQRRFVAEYLVDLNATQAAIRAGYSAKTANASGPRLLVNVGIAAAINAKQNKTLERVGLTAEKILSDVARIAAEAESTGDFGAALRGHELLGKHLKLFTDRVELSGKVSLEQLLAKAGA
jgi:phage terminase small subunit